MVVGCAVYVRNKVHVFKIYYFRKVPGLRQIVIICRHIIIKKILLYLKIWKMNMAINYIICVIVHIYFFQRYFITLFFVSDNRFQFINFII